MLGEAASSEADSIPWVDAGAAIDAYGPPNRLSSPRVCSQGSRFASELTPISPPVFSEGHTQAATLVLVDDCLICSGSVNADHTSRLVHRFRFRRLLRSPSRLLPPHLPRHRSGA